MDNNRIDIKNIPVKVETYKPEQPNQTKYASRDRIYVRSVKGLHQSLRRNMGFIFMALFMLLPWIQYNGSQAILLDIGEQKFNIFALTLWPQDFTILAWIFVIAAYALFFVTAFYGRVWCGYLCPQSVWTFIFMWFEEKIQGSRNQRMTLDQAPWTVSKFAKKALTHFCWLAFALLTSLIFVGYFTPVGPLFIDFFTFQAGFWAVISVLFFAACTYGNAGWMREIMCTHICPYARFQSAMFDKDTFTVTYDEKRGETRGPRSRKDKDYKEKGLGDCIDCNLCVHVCPTGIDIRNGLQYECINCGACIDACDDTMAKMGYPPGLISYTTEHSLNGKPTKVLRPKLVGYFVILLVVCAAFATNLYLRKPLELDIIRDRGALYRETPEGLIENTYTLSIINKSQQTKTYQLAVSGVNNYTWLGPTEVTIAGGDSTNVPVSLALDPYSAAKPVLDIEFSVTELSDDGHKVSQGINSLPAVNSEIISRFDFATLGPELILDALLQLGLDVSSGLLALNSYENRVYQFTAYPDQSLQPQKYVVKFYRPERWSPQQIQEEHDFAFELADADIPMVAPLRFNGDSLLQYQGYYFAVFPSRGGRTLEVDNDEQLAMLGRFLGRMHQVGAKKPFSSRPTFSVDSHLLQSRQVLAKLQLIPDYMRPAFDTVLQQVIAEASRQYQPGRQIRLHGDCHAGNLFYVDQGPFFVDLDDCRTGPAIQDIWMMLSGDQQEQRLTLELMLDEYEQYCDFDPAELKLIEPLRAMRIVHYMAWLARRWQDQAFVQSFPWFATDKYWEQQCLVLKEQLALLQQPPLSLVPGY